MKSKAGEVSGCEDSTGVERKQDGVRGAAQVWAESKIAREMLCFTMETAAGGREGRSCRTAVAGGCGAGFALCPGEFPMAGVFRGRGKESHVRHIIGECNCRLLDALAGEFRGRGKESHVRHIIGECN